MRAPTQTAAWLSARANHGLSSAPSNTAVAYARAPRLLLYSRVNNSSSMLLYPRVGDDMYLPSNVDGTVAGATYTWIPTS